MAAAILAGQPFACAFGGNRRSCFSFADGSQMRGQIAAVIVVGLDENRRANRMAIADIGGDLRTQIGHALFDPQVVVRVDDRQVRIKHVFDAA